MALVGLLTVESQRLAALDCSPQRCTLSRGGFLGDRLETTFEPREVTRVELTDATNRKQTSKLELHLSSGRIVKVAEGQFAHEATPAVRAFFDLEKLRKGTGTLSVREPRWSLLFVLFLLGCVAPLVPLLVFVRRAVRLRVRYVTDIDPVAREVRVRTQRWGGGERLATFAFDAIHGCEEVTREGERGSQIVLVLQEGPDVPLSPPEPGNKDPKEELRGAVSGALALARHSGGSAETR
jgi:hypothetical protein